MTEVWVVQEWVDYDGDYLCDIFATYVLAQADVQRRKRERTGHWVIRKWIVKGAYDNNESE